jgi:hypothetical protein
MALSIFEIVVQFFLLALVEAAPLSAQGHNNRWQYGLGGGIVGFVIFILDIIVFRKFSTQAYHLLDIN